MTAADPLHETVARLAQTLPRSELDRVRREAGEPSARALEHVLHAVDSRTQDPTVSELRASFERGDVSARQAVDHPAVRAYLRDRMAALMRAADTSSQR